MKDYQRNGTEEDFDINKTVVAFIPKPMWQHEHGNKAEHGAD